MPEKKDKKLIILGLTGPVGSGCTTFSKVFDDDEKNKNKYINKNELLGFLYKVKKYIKIDRSKGEVSSVHTKIDKKIRSLYVKLENIDHKIWGKKKLAQKIEKNWYTTNPRKTKVPSLESINSSLISLTQLKRTLFNELKDKLETRETIKSLDELEDFIDFPQKHHFRCISISDFILFRTLIEKDKPVGLSSSRDDQERKKMLAVYKSIINSRDILAKKQTLSRKLKTMDRHSDNFRLIFDLIKKGKNPEIVVGILFDCLNIVKMIKSKLRKKKEIYRLLMQDFGDNIRRTGNPYNYQPLENSDRILTKKVHLTLARDVENLITFLNKKRRHYFFIIDAFRNPYEALYFKEKYSDFYLISMYASQANRKERPNYNEKGDERDQGGDIKDITDHFYMQNVPKTVKFADIAINNDNNLFVQRNKPNDEQINANLIKKIIRNLALILDTGCTKPTGDEVMMNLAYTMAMKSNCISRQVGAVIEGKDGYVVGAGWNDVGEGKISCGLREIKDLSIPWFKRRYESVFKKAIKEKIKELVRGHKKDGSEYDIAEKYCFCFKDEYSKKKMLKNIDELCREFALNSKTKEILDNNLEVKRLEYCEALHAEENAIIQSSKIGGVGLKGGKIYTTSFPCELCAKKIQQVGVSEVVYTEPYPGNISKPISFNNMYKKIKTRQFEGVMPHGYFKLFKVKEDQKEWQQMYSKGLVE